MVNDPSSGLSNRYSTYSQSPHFGNLPRLLNSLTRANISYKLLRKKPYIPRQAENCPRHYVIELQLQSTGYDKFKQVFVGQRCNVTEDEDTFWDSRTGITMHISIATPTTHHKPRYYLHQPAV